ncbi:sirohydrochlorin cobaltochelatase [Desulfuromonas sp. KJ2020]|uniref:sirohydrochlorin cobaltochelatase n=1 Tax=Desulfuromonas sp. KJ2020 TaxID=2919173 RepID=UPI0020A7CBAB|nr:sirohydrochlorin cobaltochelatase [Desulfuromonas sp. KJ2020]MCP3178361.1 sirohydrochlorin cobaltochelatase [Desulfuromonas sp. KJ2020]
MPLDSLPAVNKTSPTDESRTALVLLTNGTTDPEGLAVLEEIDGWMRRRFPDKALCWAFNSPRILAVLQNQGLRVRGLPQILDDLRQKGFAAVVVQPLSVATAGEVACIPASLQVQTGGPLLEAPTAVAELIDTLTPGLDAAEPTVVVAHGSGHDAGARERLQRLAAELEARFPRLVVASLRGWPGLAPLQRLRALVQKTGRVRFVPLLLTAGHHLRTDILGDQPQSWRHQLGAREVCCSEPLGRNPTVLEIFARQIEAALQRLSHR